ncbi:16S rRNA (guanine(966)-N(2))-methyltransferase RsmD [Candidatus Izemoplasma sp. B36]|uniref:16S rRNA (guanine(966)-N(2))-methyltransferase RsmD n=1 Tax=Candidatus Izemoplasma sp. B36 TaxID=3242468 RepID=UPI0035563BDD
MLRVIGGIYKSRKIKEVKSSKTRPTTDKNKEVLFNTLGQFFDGGRMLDLFSGSGAIGIEAISRGIDMVDFIENSNVAIKTIKENLDLLGINHGVNIIKHDAFRYLNNTETKYDLIFADPPYALNKYDELIEVIHSRQLLAKGGIIVFEADKSYQFIDKYENLVKYKEKNLGNSKFAFYEMED